MTHTKYFPNELSRGYNNVVVALSLQEEDKVFNSKSRTSIAEEITCLQFANLINDLVVRFTRVDVHGNNEILVMERLIGYKSCSIDIIERAQMYERFRKQMSELHENGFVHRHIYRTSDQGGNPCDDIILTKEGIRLVDAGDSVIRDGFNENLFQDYVK